MAFWREKARKESKREQLGSYRIDTHPFVVVKPHPPASAPSSLRQRNIKLQLQRSLRVSLPRHKRHAELVLDCKDGVVGEVLAVLVENLGGEGLVVLGLDLE